MTDNRLRDVGGTPGGLGDFLIGFAMACIGGYLLANQVSVVGSYWSFYGGRTFSLFPYPHVFFVVRVLLEWRPLLCPAPPPPAVALPLAPVVSPNLHLISPT